MRLKILLTLFFTFAAAVSFARADILFTRGDSVYVHPYGSPLKADPSLQIKEIFHNGIKIKLDPKAAYLFNETKTGLKADIYENAGLEINDTVITGKGNKTVLIISAKGGKTDIRVIFGKADVKTYVSNKTKEIAAPSSFSIFDVYERTAYEDGAHYKFEEDLTKSVSSFNP
jgi:hypothetical protein